MIKPKIKNNLFNFKEKPLKDRLHSLQSAISSAPSSYLFFCFLIPAVIMYLLYLARGIHPFGNGSVLVLDLNGQYVYFYEALRNAFFGEGSFLYTFYRGLGGEFVGMYAYYLASPLSYLVVLFPQSGILEALLVIILLKTGLCGFTFGYYLHKNTAHPNKIVIVTFSVLYALSAYAVVYQNNIMWLDALICLPILTYSIEQLIKNHRYKWFVISLALTVMSNYYIGYMVCIYVMLYFFYYCFAHSYETLNPHNEPRHLFRSLLRIAAFSALAIAISAFIVLGAYYSLGFGKSDFSSPNWEFKTNFDLIDFFTKFLPGSYDTVRPEGLPYVYCGILTLLLVPAYFLTTKIKAREKVASVFFVLIFVLSFISSPLDLIWHGFQNPNWLNYRYSFMLIFFLLILAYKGFGNLKQVGEKFIVCMGALLILFTLVCSKLEFESYVESDQKLLELETVWLTIFATIALMAVLGFLIRTKSHLQRNIFSCVLAGIVCIEVFCSSVACMNQFNEDVLYSSYSGYNNFIGGMRPIVEQIKEEDPGFYRMEKLNHRKYNDNMALGIRGLSNSTSTLNAETIKFLNQMGYTARSHLSQYRGGTPVNDSLLGIKYLIDKKDSSKLDNFYEPTLSRGNYTAYYNPYALSIAYGVDDAVKELKLSDFNTYFERLNAMVKTMAGSDEVEDVFRPVGNYTVDVSNCNKTTTSSTITYRVANDGESAFIEFRFTAPYSGEYYFYPANRSVTETKLIQYINGEKQETSYLGSDTNTIYSLGYFELGETVEISLKFESGTLVLNRHSDYFWYIDREAFESAFRLLKENPQFIIDEDYTEDHLTGTVQTAKENQTIQTTIPYDEGWKVYVDGQQVPIYKTMDALIAFDISESGDHTLELKYCPTVYVIGAVISACGLILFIAVWVLEFLFRKKLKKERKPLLNEMWVLDDFDRDYAESQQETKMLPTAEQNKNGTPSEVSEPSEKDES